MDTNTIKAFWRATVSQEADGMRKYLSADAQVRWHNTNELFTAEEYIRANCEYPNNWDGSIERIEATGNLFIVAGKVYPSGKPTTFHVVSFFETQGGKISAIDEYWGEDGTVPDWRAQLKLGKPIR